MANPFSFKIILNKILKKSKNVVYYVHKKKRQEDGT